VRRHGPLGAAGTSRSTRWRRPGTGRRSSIATRSGAWCRGSRRRDN